MLGLCYNTLYIRFFIDSMLEGNILYRRIRRTVVSGVAAILLAGTHMVFAMPEILPVSEITGGMSGQCYTVMDESGEIRPFRVDIIGVYGNGSDEAGKMIMAEASGALIDQTGGVLQGMSGSPVYVGNQLVGALSATMKETSRNRFFITPIGTMLQLWTMPDTKGPGKFPTVDLKKIAEEKEKAKEAEKKKEEKKENAGKPEGGEQKPADVNAAKPEEKTEKSGQDPESSEVKDTPGDRAKDTEENKSRESEKVMEEAAGEKAVSAEDAAGKDSREKDEMASFCYAGFDAAGLSFLNRQLAPYGIRGVYETALPTGMSSGADTSYQSSLQAGSPVGAALIYGDFFFGATGTVTAVEGNKVLAFGHPFLHLGNVNYFMTEASVLGSMQGPTAGMKMANAGNIVGRINQDRAAGISGVLGTFPEVVPMRVTVRDKFLNREQSFGVRMAYNEELMSQLSSLVAYSAISRISDTQAASTATVKFSISTDAADGGHMERTNMFYNGADVGQVAVMELAQAVEIICSNEEKASDILELQVDVTVENGCRVASLISAIPDKTKVQPGETVNFKTTIKPYRQKTEEIVIPYTVPKTQAEGTMNLDIRGGGLIPVNQAAMLQSMGLVVADDGKKPTVQEQLNNLKTMGKNNEIIIAPGAVTDVQSEQAQKRAIRDAVRAAKKEAANHKVNLLGKKKRAASPETKYETGYIIDNVIHASLQIKKK